MTRLRLLVCLCAATLNTSKLSASLSQNTGGVSYKNDRAKNILQSKSVKFIENRGQVCDMSGLPAPIVLFSANAPGMQMFVTEKGLTYLFARVEEKEKGGNGPIMHGRNAGATIHWERVDMLLKGANMGAGNAVKEFPSGSHYNYFTANAAEGIYGVQEFAKITFRNVYKGIDFVLYNSTKEGFKYDFVVHPGADANQIQLEYSALAPLEYLEDGDLRILTKTGTLTEHSPYSYLRESGKEVKSSFLVAGHEVKDRIHCTRIKFSLQPKDDSQTLVIDPQLYWSTFMGGSTLDGPIAAETDASGNLFVAGYTGNLNFPTLNAGTFFQGTFASNSTFLMKFNNSGVLLWSTFYGSDNSGVSPRANSLAIDQSGNVFIAGMTVSAFPVQNAGTYFQGTLSGVGDAFIVKFDNAGNRLWATLYGGSNFDYATGISVDKNGSVFVTGVTESANFPLQNAGTFFQTAPTASYIVAGFVLKFDNAGNRQWATYCGQNVLPDAITTDLNGRVFITGYASSNPGIPALPLLNPGGGAYYQSSVNATYNNTFILKFDNAGNQLWGTYYGGNTADMANSIITDRFNNVFILGRAGSSNFPLQNAGTYFKSTWTGGEAYILKFDSAGVRKWATFLGGSNSDGVNSYDNLAIDSCGNLYVGMETRSNDLPYKSLCDGGYIDSTYDNSTPTNNFALDLFLIRFDNFGNLQWGTYFGADGADTRSVLELDPAGNLFVCGEFQYLPGGSSNYPLANPGGGAYYDATFNGSEDAFVSKFSVVPPSAQTLTYATVCATGTLNPAPVLPSGILTGGSFTSTQGLHINPLTGVVTASLSAPGIYTVTYGDAACSCILANKVTGTIALVAAPVVSVTSPTVCFGSSAVLHVTSSPGSGLSYTWVGISAGNVASVAVTPVTTTAYTVIATNAAGCSGQSSALVTISECLDISSYEAGSKFRIFPNPNSGEFTISSDSEAELQLVNELGEIIRSIHLSKKGNYKVTVKGIAAGIYFVTAGGGFVKKILVE